MTAPPWLGTAQDATLCNFGTTGAAFAASAAWYSAYTGQIWGTVGFGAVSAALAAGSAAYGCYSGEPEQPTNEYGKICCQEWSNSTADVFWQKDDGDGTRDGPWPANVKKLVSWRVVPGTPSNKPPGWVNVEFVTDKYGDGNTATVVVGAPALVTGDAGCMTLGMTSSGSCVSTAPDPGPILPDPPDSIPYTDPDTGCTWNTTMFDAYLNAQGVVVIGYVATSADPDVCGGPIYWWEEAGKPPRIVQPDPTDPTNPDKPIPPPEPLPCCDDIKAKLDEIKDCACGPDEQPLEGDYRTISFISDEYSPEGRNRVRKRFRYRSSSGVGLSGVVEHWRSFTWAAGPVCVSHKGSTLGAPQVWAATAEEGKRVIRHAAGEAGINADQVGRWLVSGSTDPRYGMPGTMRVNTKGGYYWITSRLGPDERPLVQET